MRHGFRRLAMSRSFRSSIPCLLWLPALCLLLVSCGISVPESPPEPPRGGLPRVIGNPPGDAYTRTLQRGADEYVLQTGSRLFRRAGSPDVDLVGVIHIAEAPYYHRLQRRLDRADLVLYEKVVDERYEHLPPETFDKAQHRSAYGRLASSLGLAMQTAEIDYRRPNFRRSDLTIQQMYALLEQEMASGTDEGGAAQAHASMGKLKRVLSGRSFVMNGALWLVGANRGLQSRMRLAIVALGVKADDDEGALKESPRLQKLIQDDRNEQVMRDLEAALRESRPRRRIALFYGSAHHTDLEKRLRRLGYQPAGPVEWETAVTSRPHAEGIRRQEVEETLRIGR